MTNHLNMTFMWWTMDTKDRSIERLKEDFDNESEISLNKFILNKENKGFAHANNVALNKTSAKYVLLLNSDTIVVDNCLEKSLELHGNT